MLNCRVASSNTDKYPIIFPSSCTVHTCHHLVRAIYASQVVSKVRWKKADTEGN